MTTTRRMALVALCWAGALGVGTAGAQNSCDGALSEFDAVSCDPKLFVRADGDLN